MSTIYANSIVISAGNEWEFQFFTVANPAGATYTLNKTPAQDDDGDPRLVLKLNGVTIERSFYALNGAVITWGGTIPLEAGEILEAFYQPIP